MNLAVFARKVSFQEIARSTRVVGCKPSGGDGGSYSWAPDKALFIFNLIS